MTAADVLRSLRLLSHTAMFKSRPKHRFLSCKDPYKHFNLSFPNEFLLIKCWQFQAKFLWLPSPTQKCLGFPYSESTGLCKQKATALIQSRLLLSCPSPRHPKSSLLSFQKPGALWDLPQCTNFIETFKVCPWVTKSAPFKFPNHSE